MTRRGQLLFFKWKEIDNMKKKNLIKRILDYQFPWTRKLAEKEARENKLLIAALKGDEEEFWKIY